jgi:hypothetical protein
MAKKRIVFSSSDVTGGDKKKLALLEADTRDYSAISLDHLLIYAMGEMEKLNIRMSEPNIAVAAWRIFPKDKFSLFGYPEYPDSNRAHTGIWHLVHAKKRWITGTGNEYVITEKGRKLIEDTEMLLSNNTNKRKSYSKTRRQDKLLKEIKTTTAFLKYKKDEDITMFDLVDLLQCTLDSSEGVLKENFDALCIVASEEESEEVSDFLKILRRNFEEVKNG